MNKKVVALVLACVLIFSTIVAGTLAFLYAKTNTITNTFTFGNVGITLTETGAVDGEKAYTLIPGTSPEKDPKVTVTAGSEDAWVFVKVEETGDTSDFITYEIDSNWSKVEDGVYVLTEQYTEGTAYSVLKDNKVNISAEVPNGCDDTITLGFTAYAIQKTNFDSAAEAWEGVEAELAKVQG